MTAEPVVLLEGVAKSYPGRGGGPVEALRVGRWEVPPLAQVAVTGDSGSGKSTLLHVLAGIVLPDRGRVVVHGTDIAVLPEAARDRFRGRTVGLVFQSLNLFRGLTALENLLAAPLFAGRAARADRARALALLERVGLSGRAGHRPREMSLGEQQRVAIARALMNAPPLLLCDEPTGSLDARNRDEVVALLRSVAAEEKATLLVVTHDEAVVAAFPGRVRVGDLAPVTHEGFVGRSLRHRRLATALSALAVALGVALVCAVDGLRREARAHFEGAAGTWDLVVGPKGDPMRIVLNAVFHLGESTGTVPESVWRKLREDPRVERAVPYAVGDSFEGFRVVGTSAEFLGGPVRVGTGAVFGPFDPSKPRWEAVLGATVSAVSGLKVGDSFVASHGLDAPLAGSEHREAPWRVTGILERTGTPVDRIVLIPLEAFWSMEGHDASAGRKDRQVSAVLVKTRNAVFTRLLYGEIRASADAQPAFPFQEVRNLFDLVGNADRILMAVAALVVAVAALGILVSMVNTMNERRRDLALMRALGARRRVVAGLLVGEAALVGAIGAALGLAMGHALIAAGAARLGEWSGVRIRPFVVAPEEVLVFGGAVLLCALAGLLPAVMAYRSDVASGLSGES